MHFLSIRIVPGKIKFFNSSREKALRCNLREMLKKRTKKSHAPSNKTPVVVFFSILFHIKQHFMLRISLFLRRFAFLFESSGLKEKPQSAAICSALIVQKMHF